jgi:hypothetical protein
MKTSVQNRTAVRHPLIMKWQSDRARAAHLNICVGRFSPLEYRQHRFLSSLFFAVEERGIAIQSNGHPAFVFVHELIGTKCHLGPVEPGQCRMDAALQFKILDIPTSYSSFQSQWVDSDIPLESRITELADAVTVIARANSRDARLRIQSALEKDLLKAADRLKFIGGAPADSVAAQLDPRCFQLLSEMAERHRSSVKIRRFLRALERSVLDRDVVVAGSRLDDWFAWADRKATEHDPLTGGAEHVFSTIATF